MQDSENENDLSLILFKSCDELKQEFLDLETPRQLAELLEVPYSLLVYHIYKVPDDKKYVEFLIPKKSGGYRKISSPSTALKIIQRKLSQVLYSVYTPKAPVHGFTPSRSIVTNAEQHVRKRFVFNIDISDFFGSIHFGRVRGVFMKEPYNRPSEVATVLAQICCFSNKLPQGAPTSPVVSNMVCARLDSQLRLLAKERHCSYTRYADDITFSTRLTRFPSNIAYLKPECDEVVVGNVCFQLFKEMDLKLIGRRSDYSTKTIIRK